MFLIIESLKISWQILKENKLRSFLTTLGILIGVTTIIFIHSVLVGVEDYIVDEISTMGANTVYITKYSWMNSNWRKERKRPPLKIKDANFLRNNCPQVSYVAPILNSSTTVKYHKENLSGVQLVGSSEDYLFTSDSEVDLGRFFTNYEISRKSDVVVLGYTVKEAIFKNENPVGRTIFLGKRKFTVIGTLAKKGEIFGNTLDNNVIVPIGTLKKYFPYWKRNGIDIAAKIKNPEKMNYSLEKITEYVRISRGLDSFRENNFSVNQMSQALDFYNKMTGSMQLLIIIIGSLSLVTGGIGIMNIMLVSVTERTREIGTRKALGATRGTILTQFLIESVSLCSIGGITGVIFGFIIANTLSSFTPVPSSISLISVIVGVGFSTLIGIIFGLYPATKAAKLLPIEALRYE